MNSIRLPAFAKINLRLEIVGRRPDGYHELRTIFQTISLRDELRLELLRTPGTEIVVRPGTEISRAELAALSSRENLVFRAVDALRRELAPRAGLRIELEKNIPIGRGLGGGSADAAAALIGLLRLTGKRVPLARLMETASSLGADVPFFLFGGRALGVGRGDEIYPLPDTPRRTIVVVSPRDIAISTREAYRWAGARLTKRRSAPTLWSFCALCWSPQGAGVSNDFEAPVFERYPRLRRIKQGLLERGAAEAALAGSGSAVFGVFQNPAQARRAAQRFPGDQVFAVETLTRAQYLRALRWRGPEDLPTQ
jgi:4-diphosphocytidyl-2-C-methyl-D-erythritol kinase